MYDCTFLKYYLRDMMVELCTTLKESVTSFAYTYFVLCGLKYKWPLQFANDFVKDFGPEPIYPNVNTLKTELSRHILVPQLGVLKHQLYSPNSTQWFRKGFKSWIF